MKDACRYPSSLLDFRRKPRWSNGNTTVSLILSRNIFDLCPLLWYTCQTNFDLVSVEAYFRLILGDSWPAARSPRHPIPWKELIDGNCDDKPRNWKETEAIRSAFRGRNRAQDFTRRGAFSKVQPPFLRRAREDDDEGCRDS